MWKLIIPLILLFSSCAQGFRYSQFLSRWQNEKNSAHYIENVPFFKQSAHQCGPSALASVLAYYKKSDANPEKIANEIILSGSNGTLNLEMLLYPRRSGLITEMVNNDFENIKKLIRKGYPVILLIDDGFLFFHSPHYIVLIGFDEKENLFIAHWGIEPNRVIRDSSLRKKWERAGGWGFVAMELSEEEITPEQHNNMGVAYEDAGKRREAEHESLRAISKRKDFCEPLFNLGNICYKNGNLKKAEQWYLNALSRCEKKGDIYNNLAYLYMKMNNIIKAIENIQKALSLDPENMEYLDTRAEIYKKRLPSP